VAAQGLQHEAAADDVPEEIEEAALVGHLVLKVFF
jgi:hypothetical protein